MTNRREFLQAAAAVSAAPVAASAAGAAAGFFAPLDLYAVVIDRRFAEAQAFGARWAEAGVALRTIEADITALWNEELRRAWADAPAAIAGLTDAPALFLLERLAWDHRMRVVFHAEHRPGADGSVAHALLQGGAGLAASDLEAAGDRWPDALARALAGHPPGGEMLRPTPSGLAQRHGEQAAGLASWVIAPVQKA